MSIRTAIARLTLAVVAAAGCRHDPGRPAVAPVRGRATYNGTPIAGATVSFLSPRAPHLAIGTTDENGAYRLTT